jgi:hypothetical protein
MPFQFVIEALNALGINTPFKRMALVLGILLFFTLFGPYLF